MHRAMPILASTLSVLALLAVAVISLGVGPSGLPLGRVLEILVAGPNGTDLPAGDVLIVWQIRMPRMLLGALIGASLAVAGAVLQGLFRNPLADPGLVGVSSGAALGAVSTIVLASGAGALDCVWRAGVKQVEKGRHRNRSAVAATYRASIERIVA